jgi:hypothetical protein
MKETTHREYLLWVEYFEEQWNRPTKQDWYLAQIAREVSCVLEDDAGRKRKTVKSFLLKFGFGSSKKESAPTEGWKHSKAVYAAATRIKKRPDGNRS